MTGGEHCGHALQSVQCVETACNMKVLMIGSAGVAGLTCAAGARLSHCFPCIVLGFQPRVASDQKDATCMCVSLCMCLSVSLLNVS